MRGSKIRVIWENANDWAKRLVVILGLFAGLAPAWLYIKDVLDKNILWYFKATESMMQQWRVRNGIDEALMIPINTNYELYTVLSDGVKRDAFLFTTDYGESFVYIDDKMLGSLVFSAYYNEARAFWYFYSFEDDPYTIIYKK